ncbi:AGAP000718-PA-like protein [Anopheles sinensis]|uniref:AGAP000718-PA-like protein n=1 Tax=Anopheles sinensis TaxID=74873 RepID=A0A084VVS0_ANOSI|nr:AGAP000718-PA-like protein [Anopheles sinensis]
MKPDASGSDDDAEYTNQATMRIDDLQRDKYTVKMRPKPANGDVRVPKAASKVRQHPKLPKNRSQLGSDFVAPDGGWGWMVVLAAGFSNLCTFPVLQQFGLLFKERMSELSINASEVTTIINTHSALTSIVGLANGPMFRRFTYRQVAFFGALLVGVAVTLTSLASSFVGYMLTFAILYGAGVGINASANSLALNTYFKQKRRIATGFAWTLTGLGPIVAPHIITLLQRHVGTNGTVLLFGGFAMNAVALALLYQPVQWHARTPVPTGDDPNLPATPAPSARCSYCQSAHDPRGVPFNTLPIERGPQDLLGYDAVVETGTPMLSRANDGWYSRSSLRSLYGSRLSLTTPRYLSLRPSMLNLGDVKTYVASPVAVGKVTIDECHTEDCPTVQAEHEPLRRPTIVEGDASGGGHHGPPKASTVAANLSSLASSNTPPAPPRKRDNPPGTGEKDVLKQASKRLAQLVEDSKRTCTCSEVLKSLMADEQQPAEPPPLNLLQRIAIFFDLDLLRDFVYLNIMVGITLANFAELNFSILTPFVLADFGCTRDQIAMAMSVLGVTDITCRCIIPLLAERISWQNRTFFLIGVINMALGRIVLAHFHSYPVVLTVACWIGFNKGLRTVFMALAIPSHVSLDRLPGATGIHLLFAGLFYFFVGPLVGLVRDSTNYATTLHVLNIATFTMAISWCLEMYYFTPRQRKRQATTKSPS